MKQPFIIIGTVDQVLEKFAYKLNQPNDPNAVDVPGETKNPSGMRIEEDLVLIPLSVFATTIKVPIEDLTIDIFLDVWNSIKEITGRFPIRELEVDEVDE